MENKKAFTTFALIFVIFFAVFILINLAIFSYSISLVDNQISELDFMIGNQSFNETYQNLVHPGMEVLSVNSPRIISISTILGMILILLIIGMKTERKNNLWIILDLFIIIVAEIVAVAIKVNFEENILNLTPELYTIFTTTLAEGSKWILNMPTTIPIIGALIMLATYLLRKEEKGDETGGFRQIENE